MLRHGVEIIAWAPSAHSGVSVWHRHGGSVPPPGARPLAPHPCPGLVGLVLRVAAPPSCRSARSGCTPGRRCRCGAPRGRARCEHPERGSGEPAGRRRLRGPCPSAPPARLLHTTGARASSAGRRSARRRGSRRRVGGVAQRRCRCEVAPSPWVPGQVWDREDKAGKRVREARVRQSRSLEQQHGKSETPALLAVTAWAHEQLWRLYKVAPPPRLAHAPLSL